VTRPTGRTLALAAALLPLAAAPAIADAPGLWWPWAGAWLLLLLTLLVEFALLPPRALIEATVQHPPAIGLGEEASVDVTIAARQATRIEVLLDVDGPQAPWPATSTRCGPTATTQVRLPLQPDQRGIVQLQRLHLAWHGPLQLLRHSSSEPLLHRIPVLPNLPMVRRKALQMLDRRELRSGARVERYLGDGSEFTALREFVAGMDRRAIDWKATARHRKLLSREFRAERDHNVLLCLDTGRLMREPLAGIPRLDHAIHAALQLGYVCLRTGDRVGLYTFAEQPQHFVSPQAGMHTLEAIQVRMAELSYGSHETNFTLGLTDLLQRLPRRSLVVLFTEFVDSITAELMLRNLQWLARRHVLLFVALRDPLLPALTNAYPSSTADLHRAVVAGEMLRERELVLERLRSLGVQVIDCGTDQLAVDLVDRYLAVKRRELV
jgi:uncharacterized protein (DUF58 family)